MCFSTSSNAVPMSFLSVDIPIELFFHNSIAFWKEFVVDSSKQIVYNSCTIKQTEAERIKVERNSIPYWDVGIRLLRGCGVTYHNGTIQFWTRKHFGMKKWYPFSSERKVMRNPINCNLLNFFPHFAVIPSLVYCFSYYYISDSLRKELLFYFGGGVGWSRLFVDLVDESPVVFCTDVLGTRSGSWEWAKAFQRNNKFQVNAFSCILFSRNSINEQKPLNGWDNNNYKCFNKSAGSTLVKWKMNLL